jgi:protein-tyrosine-phosphatase
MGRPITLILCTGNSCGSHRAKGILRAASSDDYILSSGVTTVASLQAPGCVHLKHAAAGNSDSTFTSEDLASADS